MKNVQFLSKSLFENIRKPHSIVILCAAIYFVTLSTLCITSHLGFKTYMIDLGKMDQAIWLASQGHLDMAAASEHSQIPVSRLAIHSNFMYYLIAPFYCLWADPIVLLLLISLACMLAGYGLYWIARDTLGNSWSAIIPALAFWLSPMVHDANLYDFHLTPFIAAFFVWMIWSFNNGHRKAGWILFSLTLLCQENAGLLTLAYGIYLTLDTQSRKRGLWIIGFSIMFLISITLFMSHLQNTVENFSGVGWRYGWLKENFPKNIPHILKTILRPDRLRLPFYFLLSGAIVAWRAWPIFILLVPFLLEGMFSATVWSTRLSGTYYWVTPEAVIILACIFASKKFISSKTTKTPFPLRYLLRATLLFSLIYSPLPYGIFSSFKSFSASKDRAAISELNRLIPQDAHLVAQNNIAPHFSRRKWIGWLNLRHDLGDYILIHLRHLTGPDNTLYTKSSPYYLYKMQPVNLVKKTKALIDSKNWGLIACQNGFYLFARDGTDKYKTEWIEKTWEQDSKTFLKSIRSLQVWQLPVVSLAVGQYDWPWNR